MDRRILPSSVMLPEASSSRLLELVWDSVRGRASRSWQPYTVTFCVAHWRNQVACRPGDRPSRVPLPAPPASGDLCHCVFAVRARSTVWAAEVADSQVLGSSAALRSELLTDVVCRAQHYLEPVWGPEQAPSHRTVSQDRFLAPTQCSTLPRDI